MYKRSITFLSAICLLSFSSFSQSIQQNIEKQARDPKTAENAAKADVYIQDKKIIKDDIVNDQSAVTTIDKKKKKKNCKKNRK